MVTLDELIRRVRDLPPLPDLVLKLLAMCRDSNVAPRDIVGVIELDPALTLKVLRLCNSPFYGVPHKVTTVHSAVVYLGADAIVNYLLAGCLASFYGSENRGYSLAAGEAWRHALGTAVCAQLVGERCDAPLAPLAFTCGLLHDVGKTVLDTAVAAEKPHILAEVEKNGLTFLEAERAVLGFDHAQAGAALANLWNLPEETVESIRWHHDPLRAPHHVRLVCLVHVGNILCERIGIGLAVDGLTCRFQPPALEALHMTVEDILSFSTDADVRLKAAIESFQTT